MTKEGFLKRLEDKKVNNYLYTNNQVEGIVAVWKYKDKYILTWEECHFGEQYNENRYTKDQKHIFEDFDQLIDFLEKNNLQIKDFVP